MYIESRPTAFMPFYVEPVTKTVEKVERSREHLEDKVDKLLYDTAYAYHPHNHNRHTIGKFRDFAIR